MGGEFCNYFRMRNFLCPCPVIGKCLIFRVFSEGNDFFIKFFKKNKKIAFFRQRIFLLNRI